MSSQKKKLMLLTILTVLLLIFIWGNSFMPVKISAQLSGWLYQLLRGERAIQTMPTDSVLVSESILRKLMHATEFMTLGILLSHYPHILQKRSIDNFGFCLLLGLFAGSLDEFIQIFNDRYPCIRDVCIDFSGFLVGTLLVWGIALLIRRKKKARGA